MDSKMVNQSVFIRSLTSLATQMTQADEDDGSSITVLSLVVFCSISITYADLGPCSKPSKDFPGFTSFSNTRIYIETAAFVVFSYVSLLLVNWSNIWLAVFPIIAVGFVLALCYELSHRSGAQQCEEDEDKGIVVNNRETRKTEGQEAAVLVSYWVLCATTDYLGADNMVISQFLLFFSSMLSALARMMTRLELTGAAPGVASASVLLWKASLVMLLVTVHAFAAELLGKNIMLFILPELAPVLIWFSLNLDRRDSTLIIVGKIKSHRNVITAFAATVVAVIFAFIPAVTNELILSWCTKGMVSCGVSGLLVYCIVFMLCQWPGLEDSMSTPFVIVTVKLLELWATILLVVAACAAGAAVLAFDVVDHLGLHRQLVAEPSKFFSD